MAIGEHLLNNLECSKNYKDKMFSIVCKRRNMYHLSVLEFLFINSNKPSLCEQKSVYNY